jgi:hypothetical protein
MNKTVQIDSETIIRCQRGDKAAFRLVVQNCQRMVFSLSLKILADEERVLQRFASDADSHRTLENTEWMAIVRLLAEGLSEKQRCYALTSFLLVICPAAFRLQWNPIAHSKQQDICSKIKAVFIITLMTDSG